MEKKIKLGVACTRRNLFSRLDAIKYKDIILKRLTDEKIDFVDVNWLNEDGLLYEAGMVDAVYERFTAEKVDALFIPHCNFGCEEAVCNLAKRLGVPVLLWGPRDEAPLADGLRLRDSQCGLFATSKDLMRFHVPFTYMINSWVDGDEWVNGLKQFLKVAAVVKSMKSMKIGQIDTRPRDFFSVICDENRLLEKFNIQVIPASLTEITSVAMKYAKTPGLLDADVEALKKVYVFDFEDEYVYRLAGLKRAMKEWAETNSLDAIAVQCWNALQDEMGISACFVNAALTDEGLPVVCETDINGAVTAILTIAATGWQKPIFFADVTVRHPTNDNAELLWHCGPFPASMIKDGEKANVKRHGTLPTQCPGACEYELKHGDITIVRFDGINDNYSLFATRGKGVDGPMSRGTYLWTEFKDWEEVEKKLIYGPYIHHIAGVYEDVIPVLEEACKYIPGLTPDFIK